MKLDRALFCAALLAASVLLYASPSAAGDNDGYCRRTNISGYEQYFIPSLVNGDEQGTPFVFGRDQMMQSGVAVFKIRAWTGNR